MKSEQNVFKMCDENYTVNQSVNYGHPIAAHEFDHSAEPEKQASKTSAKFLKIRRSHFRKKIIIRFSIFYSDT